MGGIVTEKVAVLLGGTSAERPVSLESGQTVLEGLLQAGVDACGVDVRDFPVVKLKEAGFSKAFIALHGRGGEDGTIQGVLEFLGVPYTGSGVMASALAMDKWRTKLVWQAMGILVAPYVVVNKGVMKAGISSGMRGDLAALGFPVVVKPCKEGSSVGLSKACCAEELDVALKVALELDDEALVEKWLSGREYSVGILGDQVLPAVRIQTSGELFDYNAKYVSQDTKYFCPSGLSPAKEEEIADLVRRCFHALGCRGWGRVDVMEDGGKFYPLEVNAAPGMSSHSLLPMAAKVAGMDMPMVVKKILDLAQ